MHTWPRLGAGACVAVSLLIVGAGCGSDERGPNADPGRLFPTSYTEKAFTDSGSSLLKATAAKSSTTKYTFDVDVPKDQAFAIVVNCTSGQVSALGASRHCGGGPSGLVAACAGGHLHVTAQVSRAQRRVWGLAVYEVPAPAGC